MPGDARRWSNAAVWRWKHVDNPFGRSLVLLARDDATGEITGLRAFMAWQYLVGGAHPRLSPGGHGHRPVVPPDGDLLAPDPAGAGGGPRVRASCSTLRTG